MRKSTTKRQRNRHESLGKGWVYAPRNLRAKSKETSDKGVYTPQNLGTKSKATNKGHTPNLGLTQNFGQSLYDSLGKVGVNKSEEHGINLSGSYHKYTLTLTIAGCN